MTDENRRACGSLAALVYNCDKPVGRSFGDVEFYRERLKVAGAREVLEPAAGNGRVLIPLAKAGFAMTGFDNSADMLGYLKRNAAEHGISAGIVDAGFEDFELGTRFDAIVLPAGSFQLIYEIAAAAGFLRRCRSHLHAGGQLIFDLDAESEFFDPTPGVRTWQLSDGSRISLTQSVSHHDPIGQQVEYAHLYENRRDGIVVSAQSEILPLRWWRLDQIVPLLLACGFRDVIASGAYVWRCEPCAGEIVTLEAIAG